MKTIKPAGVVAPVCPICRKPATSRYSPFCSARCSEVDLGRWFGETYRVPAEPVEEHSSDDDLPG
jgi:endogenous inhibitor of DNA gyrase (YacG/DUF329 family)